MNRVLLTGRLTRDPELRALASGKSVAQFGIATHDYRSGSEKAEYHNVVTWDMRPHDRFRTLFGGTASRLPSRGLDSLSQRVISSWRGRERRSQR